MALFDPAIQLVLAHEGGYANDPSDPGGETSFGISKRSYPNLDIKALTKIDAEDIYGKDYWTPKMRALADQCFANCALDCAVNQGPEVANAFLSIAKDLREFQHLRLLRYTDIAFRNTALRKDLNGWIKRTLDVGQDS